MRILTHDLLIVSHASSSGFDRVSLKSERRLEAGITCHHFLVSIIDFLRALSEDRERSERIGAMYTHQAASL